MEKNKKIRLFAIAGVILVLVLAVICINLIKKSSNKKDKDESKEVVAETQGTTSEPTNAATTEPTTVYVDNKVDIVDVDSKTRPFAVSINNTPVAVQVQTGLNNAFIVYEIPTEGYTSRMLALFKDKEDAITVGTIRSARHNFLDFCFESDAIFVHFGASEWAERDEATTGINWINGFYDSPFWRENPEDLASEHTAYTSLDMLKVAAGEKGFNTEAESAEDTILLNYSIGEIDLSKMADAVPANTIDIPYSSYQHTTFVYDSANSMYLRYENDEPNIDHQTKEQFNTENIIVQKISHGYMEDNYCWDLHTVGSGEGYYITNGYAVPINWSKSSRTEKTIFTYVDGTEIEVGDGRTYIEVSDWGTEVTIE